MASRKVAWKAAKWVVAMAVWKVGLRVEKLAAWMAVESVDLLDQSSAVKLVVKTAA